MRQLSTVLVVAALLGCGGVAQKGDGGPTGSAGTTGGAGTTGDAGTTGASGTSGAAGTGSAGSSDGGATDGGSSPDGTESDVAVEKAACSADAGSDEQLLAGHTYGEYAVESIDLLGAPCGVYTLWVQSSTSNSVQLRDRGGAAVATVSYAWQTTVSATDPAQFYKFHFAGYLDLTVRKSGSGTINLYDIDQFIFDNKKVLVVP
jgi:hypothetical protein